jgi:hypothetical protein
MAITEWHTPIHECQKGEVQRERCYLEPYYFFTGNIREYSELLQYAFDKKHAGNSPQTRQEFEEYLSKHPICFYPDDVRKGKPPSLAQLQHWSKGQNTSCDEKYNWDERRSSKRNEVNRLAEENLAAQMVEDLPFLYLSIKDDIAMVDESVENSRLMGNLTPHQAESATKAKHHIIDGILKLTGKDKDYKLKADVESQSKVEYAGVDNLLEAFHASKAEWDKHKPQ